jgi:hypothetical protein
MRPRLRSPQLQLFETAFNEHLNLPPLERCTVFNAITILLFDDISVKEAPPQRRLASDKFTFPESDTKILSVLSLHRKVVGSLTSAQDSDTLKPVGASAAHLQSVPRK